MLQIYCYGPTESGFLDIPPSAKIDMESLAEPFDEDLAIGEYSLPGTLDWTPRNLRITGFANRLTNYAKGAVSFKIDLYDSGFPEIQGGKLTILEKNGELSMQRGKFAFNISGTKGLFGSAIRGKKLSALSLSGPITFTETSSRAFAQALMTGTYPNISHVAFAPIAIFNFFNTERPDYDGEFLALNTANNIVVTDTAPEDWEFARPQSASPTTPAAEGTSEFLDYRTIPFLRLQFVIRKCFEEFGFTPTGPFFSQPWFANAFLFNNYAIERYDTASSTDTTRTITPSNHVPDITIKEFIIKCCSTFAMYPRFTSAGTVEFRFRRNQFQNITIFDITPYVSNTFSSSRQIAEENTGYTFAYDFSSDSQAAERTPNLSDKTIVATVATRSALDTLDIGRTFTINDIALVEAENMWYRIADATAIPYPLWEAYADNLYPISVNENGNIYPLQSAAGNDAPPSVGDGAAIPPPTTHVTLNPSTATFESKEYLGINSPGSYINNNLRTIRQACPLSIFFIGRLTNDPLSHPITHYHNRYANNTRRSRYSLALSGTDGMFTNFHKQWLDARTQPEIVKITIRVNPEIYNRIRAASQIQLHTSRYLLYRTERALPMETNTTITIELALL